MDIIPSLLEKNISPHIINLIAAFPDFNDQKLINKFLKFDGVIKNNSNVDKIILKAEEIFGEQFAGTWVRCMTLLQHLQCPNHHIHPNQSDDFPTENQYFLYGNHMYFLLQEVGYELFTISKNNENPNDNEQFVHMLNNLLGFAVGHMLPDNIQWLFNNLEAMGIAFSTNQPTNGHTLH